MRNIKLLIEFDGSNFSGWQRQPKGRTVQNVIEAAISKATGEQIMINGSSRTDAGVHAREMVANFFTNSTIPGEKFREALNTRLPNDVSIIKSEEVDDSFHARYSSKGKTYSYTIVNREERLSLGYQYLYHYKYKLDINEMKKACKYFIGSHDFRAFMSPGSSAKTTVRDIKELFIEEDGDRIKIIITADGFLYNMVRIIVGTLLKVGNGRLNADEIEEIIIEGNRKKAGICIPPNGLILEKVFY
jgi:tRNA pseudouridine38-40 synthase